MLFFVWVMLEAWSFKCPDRAVALGKGSHGCCCKGRIVNNLTLVLRVLPTVKQTQWLILVGKIPLLVLIAAPFIKVMCSGRKVLFELYNTVFVAD